MTIIRPQRPTDYPRPARVSVLASTPSHKSRANATATPEPEVQAETPHDSATPGCFAQAFNQLFIAAMTKLFGRDGRG